MFGNSHKFEIFKYLKKIKKTIKLLSFIGIGFDTRFVKPFVLEEYFDGGIKLFLLGKG